MKKRKNEEQKIDFKYNLREYWSIMRKYKLVIISILILLLIQEIANITGKYLFKIIVDKGTLFANEGLAKTEFISILLIIAVIYLSIEIINFGINWNRHKFINKIETSAILDLKRKYFNHIIGLSHNFFTTHKTGSLISRLSRGGSALERITDVFVFNGIPLIFQFVVAVTSLIYFDLTSSIIIAITVLIFVTFSFIMQRMQEPSNIEANMNEDIEKANISDIFTNVDSIKYFGKENYIQKRFFNLANKTRLSFVKNWSYYKIMSSFQNFILGMGTFFLVLFSIMKVLNGSMTIGTLVFIYSVYLAILEPLFGFIYGIRNFYRSMADFQDLFSYGKIEAEIKDKKNAEDIKIIQGSVEFRDVEFKYGNRKIFSHFNLQIEPNKKIALVGHSGSGKTTLMKLLYRLYDVNSGSIIIDNQDIKEIKHQSLRNEMAIVPQECILFDDTVYNNIAFSRPSATKAEVMKAIKFAQLDKIISKFPKKEQTIVGERGVKLSGGEKQRVSIARAILADKKILVLDEATSALDSETEHEIQKDLAKLMNGRTSIIIAHRLSTIMTADKIIVLKNGNIVQTGTHAELIKQKGEYQNLWNLQKGGYIK
jgi:ATP-binding cassette subfamily B protein